MDLIKFILDEEKENFYKPNLKKANILSSKSNTGISTKISIPCSWLEKIGVHFKDEVYICQMFDQIVICKSLNTISFSQKLEDILKWIDYEIQTKGYILLTTQKDSQYFHHNYLELRTLIETYFYFERGLTKEENDEVNKLLQEVINTLSSKKYSWITDRTHSKTYNIELIYNYNKYPTKNLNELYEKIITSTLKRK